MSMIYIVEMKPKFIEIINYKKQLWPKRSINKLQVKYYLDKPLLKQYIKISVEKLKKTLTHRI